MLVVRFARNYSVRIKRAPGLGIIRSNKPEHSLEASKLLEKARIEYTTKIVRLGQTQQGKLFKNLN